MMLARMNQELLENASNGERLPRLQHRPAGRRLPPSWRSLHHPSAGRGSCSDAPNVTPGVALGQVHPHLSTLSLDQSPWPPVWLSHQRLSPTWFIEAEPIDHPAGRRLLAGLDSDKGYLFSDMRDSTPINAARSRDTTRRPPPWLQPQRLAKRSQRRALASIRRDVTGPGSPALTFRGERGLEPKVLGYLVSPRSSCLPLDQVQLTP
jgi:hypothetical protein